MDENKEYDRWNEIKKALQSSGNIPNYFPREGEVWMSSIGKNVGYEQNGSGDNFSRPLLVVKKFNNHMFWCVPLSTKQKKFDFYFNFTDPNGEKVSAILAQMKLVSVKRLIRKIYHLLPDSLLQIRTRLRDFL